MSGKSRHGTGKPHSKSRKSKGSQRLALPVPNNKWVTQTTEPAAHTSITVPTENKPAPSAAPPVAQYPYITAELRRIVILGGIVLGILVILALVLS